MALDVVALGAAKKYTDKKIEGIETEGLDNPTLENIQKNTLARHTHNNKDALDLFGINYVTAYGAKGDGASDDTEFFQTALAENRCVYVPGGIYKLSSGIIIRDNCELELAQDAVLEFTQTTGNCITLNMSSSLVGNHATIKVPYAFSGNVIYASSTTTTNTLDVPPFTRWDPQWKSGRYVTNLNICKADYRGFHYSVDGDCSGTAVYFSADGDSHLTFIWGIHYSGIRIAGAFEYGIRAVNYNEGWLHEMHIDAFIDACETAISLEDCNQAYVSAIIQPRRALKTDGKTYVPYAKHGIKLIRSKNVDLSGSRVWDWNSDTTLYGSNDEYNFLSMYGNCRGAIVNAFQYYETSADIRELIYTDTASNLEQMTILQEPFDRWFKNRNGIPYFSDGHVEKRVAMEEDFEALFGTAMLPNFTNQLPMATDTDGTIYSDDGYDIGPHINGTFNGGMKHDAYSLLTGFIPVDRYSTIYTKNIFWDGTQGYYERIYFYDKNKNEIQNGDFMAFITSQQLATSGALLISEYELGENELKLTIGTSQLLNNVGYIRMNFFKDNKGANPIITVDEEIVYEQVGVLSNGIKINAENIVGDIAYTLTEADKNMIVEAVKEALPKYNGEVAEV